MQVYIILKSKMRPNIKEIIVRLTVVDRGRPE